MIRFGKLLTSILISNNNENSSLQDENYSLDDDVDESDEEYSSVELDVNFFKKHRKAFIRN